MQATLMMQLMSTKELVERMQMSLVPAERDWMMDATDSINRRCTSLFGRSRACLVVVECGGLELFLDMLRLWKNDELMARSALRALAALARNDPEYAGAILDLGGRRVVDVVEEIHEDGEVRIESRRLTSELTRHGSKSAIQEMKKLMVAMEYIKNQAELKKNQEASGNKAAVSGVQRLLQQEESKQAEKSDTFTSKNKKKKGGDQANMLEWLYKLDFELVCTTVVAHMQLYYTEIKVQECGCEVWQEFAKQASDMRPLLQSGGCLCLTKAYEQFKARPSFVWKAASAITSMARHEMLSSELGKRGCVQLLVETYHKFKQRADIQQQVIWALDSLGRFETNIGRFRDYGVLEILHEQLIVIPKMGGSAQAVDGKNKKKRSAKVAAADETKPDQVIVPLRLGQLFPRDQLTAYVKPKPAEEGKKKKFTFGRMRPAKTKFGRVSDDPEWKPEGAGSLSITPKPKPEEIEAAEKKRKNNARKKKML